MTRARSRDNGSATMRRLVEAVLTASALCWACGSGGPYGHTRVYTPLKEEEKAARGATNYDPVMVKRSPGKYRDTPLSVFGVVTARSAGTSGTSELTLSIRILEARNICDNQSEDSCRVTVSEREHGVVHALVALRQEDAIGEHSVGPGSLLRIVGTLGDEVHASDGEPVLRATYYRHWPRNFYVTTKSRAFMRQ